MNIFLKSQGLGFHISRFLCILLTISMVLIGFPMEIVFAKEDGGNKRIDYFRTIETIEYIGNGTQARTQSTSLVKLTRKVIGVTTAYELYELSAEGGVRVGYRNEMVGIKYGPVILRRDLSTDKIKTDEKGFKLLLATVDAIVRQVGKEIRRTGTWKTNFKFNLSAYLPQRLSLTFSVQPVDVGGASDTLLIAARSDSFTFRVAEESSDDKIVSGYYKTILVYSPSENHVYQTASSFIAEYKNEKVRIESLQFISDKKGDKPLVKLVDMREILEFNKERLTINKETPLPLWAVQSVKAYEIIHTTGLTAAERGVNPVFIPLIVTILTLDTAVTLIPQIAKWTGVITPEQTKLIESPFNFMAKRIGQMVGGERGASIGDLLTDTAKLISSVVLTGGLALPHIIHEAATLYHFSDVLHKGAVLSIGSDSIPILKPGKPVFPQAKPSPPPTPKTTPGTGTGTGSTPGTPLGKTQIPTVKPQIPPSWEGGPGSTLGDKVKPTEIRPTEVKPTEIRPTEIRPTEVKPTEIRPTEIRPTEESQPSEAEKFIGEGDQTGSEKFIGEGDQTGEDRIPRTRTWYPVVPRDPKSGKGISGLGQPFQRPLDEGLMIPEEATPAPTPARDVTPPSSRTGSYKAEQPSTPPSTTSTPPSTTTGPGLGTLLLLGVGGAALIGAAGGLGGDTTSKSSSQTCWLSTPSGYRRMGGASRLGPYSSYSECQSVNNSYFYGNGSCYCD